MTAYGERIASMEVEVRELKEAFNEHKKETEKTFGQINDKLDSLLTLRNKGAGAVWLVGVILGSGFIASLVQIFHLLRG